MAGSLSRGMVAASNFPVISEDLHLCGQPGRGDIPFRAPPGSLRVLHWVPAVEDADYIAYLEELISTGDPDYEMRVLFESDTESGRPPSLRRTLQQQPPDIVHVHGDVPGPRFLRGLGAAVVLRKSLSPDVRATLLLYERYYDDRVTRKESLVVRLAARLPPSLSSLPLVQDIPYRVSLMQSVRLHWYKRRIYRDWQQARLEIEQKWLIVLPVLNPDSAPDREWIRAVAGNLPNHWQTEVLSIYDEAAASSIPEHGVTIKGLCFESIVHYINRYAMTRGCGIVTLVNPEALPTVEEIIENLQRLCAGGPSTLVAERFSAAHPLDLSWWSFRYLCHVEPFSPSPALWDQRLSSALPQSPARRQIDVAGKAQANWKSFMQGEPEGRPLPDSDLVVVTGDDSESLPTGKTIVVLEPHSDDAFLGVGVTLQYLLRRKNRVVVLGMIRSNMPNRIQASGLVSAPEASNLQRDAIRRREGRRALEALFQSAGGEEAGLKPIDYKVLELGIGAGSGGNRQLGHTVFELHVPGAVSEPRQGELLDAVEHYQPDILVGIDAFDSHPDHVIAGRLCIQLAETMAGRRGRELPVWLYRGFSNRRTDFGEVSSLVTPVATESSQRKQQIGASAYYSQGATFAELYSKRLRNRWWEGRLRERSGERLGSPAEVEACIRYSAIPGKTDER